MFVFSMNTPGITVRPIRTIDGGTEVNDVFLDNVRVPANALVAKRIRAGPMPNTCSPTNALASPVCRNPSIS